MFVFSAEDFEPFDYTEGSLEEVRSKALSLLDFAGRTSKDVNGLEKAILKSSNPKELSDYVDAFANLVLAKTKDEDQRGDNLWNMLYIDLFGESLFSMESSIIPSEDIPAAAVVRYCLKEKKRVICGVPDGCLA